MKNLKLVIFDLAGTTVKDDGVVPSVFSSTLQTYGVPIEQKDLDQFRGASKREVIHTFAPSRANEVYEAFCANLAKEFSTNGVYEVEGASNTFLRLSEKGILIALNTGFDRQITELILTKIGWDKNLFRAVVCGDDVAQGRPAPDLILRAMQICGIETPDRVANVGDTVLDLRAGSNAGVRYNIGVLSGAHSREKMRVEPHTHLISSIQYLPQDLWHDGNPASTDNQ